MAAASRRIPGQAEALLVPTRSIDSTIRRALSATSQTTAMAPATKVGFGFTAAGWFA
jgi:hypothetical protein